MAINLKKGERISLTKDVEGGSGLTKIRMALGWTVPASAGNVDLDASAVLLDGAKNIIDTVWFRNPKSSCGSVESSGDDLSGGGGGDNEVISIDLPRVPAKVAHIVFTVTSFGGDRFSVVSAAYVRIVNDKDNSELARFNLTEKASNTGMIMARLSRQDGEWKFAAIGEGSDGRVVKNLLPHIQRLV